MGHYFYFLFHAISARGKCSTKINKGEKIDVRSVLGERQVL